MARTNVEKLRLIIVEDAGLQTRVSAAKDEADMTRILMDIGTEKGLPFDTAELEAWKIDEGAAVELNETQLSNVAGGRASSYAKYGTSYGNSIFCGFCGSTSGTYM
jgi:hypothetical protein